MKKSDALTKILSVRVTGDQLAALQTEAAGVPVTTYARLKLTGTPPPARLRQSGLGIEDRQSLAKALALLGCSRLASNLNQLARLANIGALPVSPETEGELAGAARDVGLICALLMTALGRREGGAP